MVPRRFSGKKCTPKLSKSLGRRTESSSGARSTYFVTDGGGGSESITLLTFLLTFVGVRFGVLVQPYFLREAGDLKMGAPVSGSKVNDFGGAT